MASDNGGYDYYEDEVRLELDMDDEMLLKQDTPAGSPWPAIMNARSAAPAASEQCRCCCIRRAT
jgi:hypothetical protein